jgi:hypothetical protein
MLDAEPVTSARSPLKRPSGVIEISGKDWAAAL